MGIRTLSIVVAGLLTLVAAPAAQAAEPLPDLQVEVSAPRHILPVDGWSTVSTTVTNAGTAPAANVRLTITFPDELHSSGLSTSTEWDCTSEPGWPMILTCDYVGELAAGATPYPGDHFGIRARGNGRADRQCGGRGDDLVDGRGPGQQLRDRRDRFCGRGRDQWALLE